ncbi:hypothetical protein [Paraburkholderia strydomiana]
MGHLREIALQCVAYRWVFEQFTAHAHACQRRALIVRIGGEHLQQLGLTTGAIAGGRVDRASQSGDRRRSVLGQHGLCTFPGVCFYRGRELPQCAQQFDRLKSRRDGKAYSDDGRCEERQAGAFQRGPCNRFPQVRTIDSEARQQKHRAHATCPACSPSQPPRMLNRMRTIPRRPFEQRVT